jgi:hypothetical protein
MTTQQAIQFLDDKGYYVQCLWHISDVQNRFECTNEEAQDILYNVHNNDAIVERIFEGIDVLGNFNRYKKKKDENM